jgi:hypothetical protein
LCGDEKCDVLLVPSAELPWEIGPGMSPLILSVHGGGGDV